MSDKPCSVSTMALRHTFVSMLFALVIAETAILISDLVSVAASVWQNEGIIANVLKLMSREDWLFLAPAGHLTLGFILICSSWVGWSRSIERDGSRDVQDVFSIDFIQLVIELLLVVLYFVLVRSVELKHGVSSTPNGHLSGISAPSTAPEAFWLLVIYIGYTVWDVFADALPRHFPREHRPLKNLPLASSTIVLGTGVITRCWVSILCAAAAWVIYRSAAVEVSTPLSTLWGDLALICVVTWFWLSKVLEPLVVEYIVPFEKHRKGNQRKDISTWRAIGIAVLTLMYFVCLSFM